MRVAALPGLGCFAEEAVVRNVLQAEKKRLLPKESGERQTLNPPQRVEFYLAKRGLWVVQQLNKS